MKKESVKEPESSKAAVKDKKVSSPNKKIKMILGASLGAIALVFVIGFAYIALATDLIFVSDYNNDSGLEEAEEYMKDNVITVLDSVDFDKFDKKDPLGFIDINDMFEEIEKNNKKLNKLTSSVEPEDLAGMKSEEAMFIEMSGDFDSDGDDNDSLKIDLDLFTQYSEDFDGEKLNQEDFGNLLSGEYQAELIDQLKEISIEMDGPIEANEGDKTLSMDVNVRVIDAVMFFTYNNLEVSDEFVAELELADGYDIREYEGQVIKVDLEEYLEKTKDAYKDNLSSSLPYDSKQIEKYANDFMNKEDKTDTKLYKDMQTLLRLGIAQTDVKEKDIETVRRIGNPIKNVIKNEIEDLEVFVDIEEIDAIREVDDLVCHEGELNLEGMIDSLENGSTEILNIFKNDEAFEDQESEIEDSIQEAEESFGEMRVALMESSAVVKVSTCHNDDGFAGFGLSVDGKFGYVERMSFDIKYQLVSADADFDINVPSFDVDLTDQFNTMIDQVIIYPSTDDVYDYSDSYNYDYDYNYESDGTEDQLSPEPYDYEKDSLNY
jgi:hypothetical protein